MSGLAGWLRARGTVAALGVGATLAATLLVSSAAAAETSNRGGGSFSFPNPLTTPDPSGAVSTYSTLTAFSPQNAFIARLGTNGRVCATCHVPTEGWTVGPADVRLRFEVTGGTESIFRPVDGANSPLADVSTVADRRAAYSLLLNKAVIRVGLPVPATAEFSLAAVDDPYGYASAQELSLFRRPLPSTNLRFLSAVMWDGRETVPGQPIFDDFTTQASHATIGHAQAKVGPSPDQLQQMVEFENSLSTAQVSDNAAGPLTAAGGTGGPMPLVSQPFHIGINDTLGGDPTGKPFDPVAFTLYSRWADSGHSAAQQAVARGQASFNTRRFAITGVGGLNDKLGVASLQGTCTTCHNTPNVGNHSVAMPLNIGISDVARRTPDMPLYTLRNKATGATVQTTDPGRALITGKWADIGQFKGPSLRGLASRLRTSTTARRPTWIRWSTFTTRASTSGSATRSMPIWWRFCARSSHATSSASVGPELPRYPPRTSQRRDSAFEEPARVGLRRIESLSASEHPETPPRVSDRLDARPLARTGP